jgi:hypothetical protein
VTPRGIATLRCIICGETWRQWWTTPYGPDYVYSSVCLDCQVKDRSTTRAKFIMNAPNPLEEAGQ